MCQSHVMAFDLGASNGRAIVGVYDDGKIELKEVHRFSNDPVKLGSHLYWDFPRLFHELQQSLVKAKNQGYNVQSIAIDTWGVDYGLIDNDGELMGNPVQYRDERAAEGMEELLSKYDREDLKRRTGMDCVSYNTVNQLIKERLFKYDDVEAMLNTPDLFNYFLTGKMMSEFSIASTSQLYDYDKSDWNWAFIDELKLPKNIFKEVISSGTIVGDVKQEIIDELKIDPLKVVAVASHDTASAVRAIPTEDDDFLFIATGTWIIVGSNQKSVTMNDQVIAYDLTNEGGKFPHVNLLKNHVGLWILQESKKHWNKVGMEVDFPEMIRQAREVSLDSFIDILDQRFFEPGNMPSKVKGYCQETGQQVPESIGEIVKVIEQSLAKQIATTLSHLEVSVGKVYDEVFLFGGGVQDALLCELIEKFSNKKVILGPKEATAFGNVVDQLIGLGIINEDQRRDVLRASI